MSHTRRPREDSGTKSYVDYRQPGLGGFRREAVY